VDFVRPGDTLVVVKLDRLGRVTRDVLNLVHDLEQRGANLRVLEPAIDTGGPMGRMVLTVLGMVAEMELSFIRDRQRAGIEAAKTKGVYKGRPITFDHERIVELRQAGMGPQRSVVPWDASGATSTRFCTPAASSSRANAQIAIIPRGKWDRPSGEGNLGRGRLTLRYPITGLISERPCVS
jgi:DNA invertase Pin-like site-specific DNA recombinase